MRRKCQRKAWLISRKTCLIRWLWQGWTCLKAKLDASQISWSSHLPSKWSNHEVWARIQRESNKNPRSQARSQVGKRFSFFRFPARTCPSARYDSFFFLQRLNCTYSSFHGPGLRYYSFFIDPDASLFTTSWLRPLNPRPFRCRLLSYSVHLSERAERSYIL